MKKTYALNNLLISQLYLLLLEKTHKNWKHPPNSYIQNPLSIAVSFCLMTDTQCVDFSVQAISASSIFVLNNHVFVDFLLLKNEPS